MTESEFERYWKAHRKEILSKSQEYKDAQESFKLHNGFDWLMLGLPAIVGIVFVNNSPFHSELLSWLVSAILTILCYAICIWIKSLITGNVSPGETEERIKSDYRKRLTASRQTE